MRFIDIDQPYNYVLTEAARIQHAEDLIFWEGARGALRALTALKSMSAENHQNVTLKWDGSPAVIFGRNEEGNFVFTDKSGFSAKGYDGKTKSGKELEQMFLNRSGGKNRDNPSYVAFAARMRGAFEVFERAVPADHRGYFKGDMLWFDTPPVENNNYVFKPNVVEYAVDIESELGQRIGASTAGVVIHRQVDEEGNEFPLESMDVFQGDELFVVPPVTTEKPVTVNNELLKQLEELIKKDAVGIDEFLNHDSLKEKQISDLPQVMYAYTNSKVDTGMHNLGQDFIQWLENSKLSNRKKVNIVEYIKEHKSAYAAVWEAVAGVMKVKDEIISQFDSHGGSVKQSIGGQKGGEGYVLAHPEGDIKLVPREFFTKANRAVQR